MTDENHNNTEEQKRYARVLDILAKAGFLGVVILYFIYLLKIFPEKISGAEIEKVWTLGPEYYLEVSGLTKGFSWWSLLGYGDFLMLLPIVFLSSVTILCYISILPVFFRKRELLFTGICVAEIIILLFAAFSWQATSVH